MVDGNVIDQFVKAIKPEEDNRNTIHSAVVSKIDDEGVIWVFVAGSDRETPTASTSADVKKGDTVTVEWRNNRLYIAGNYSNPSAGVMRVAAVEAAANTAKQAAANAVQDAGVAREAAQQATAEAGIAKKAADDAQTDAGVAKDAAYGAMKGLAQVEDVVGVVNWMRAHGDYTAATEHEADPNTYYFTVAVVADPEGNPREREYYELSNGIYTMTLDTQVDDRKTYYTLTRIDPIPEGADPAALGYVKMTNLQEVVADYVNMHLALLDDGLYVLADKNGWRVKITNEGIFILDENGDVVTTFSESITLSSSRSQYIGDDNAYIRFDHEKNRMLIGGKDVYMIAPLDVFTWDVELAVSERQRMNEALELSEDTSSWIYDDITPAEMQDLNERLGLSEDTSSWIYDDVTVPEYTDLCNKLGIGYQFGRSVYVGLDALSLGDGFFVDDEGYLMSTKGRIGGWTIEEDRLSRGLPTSPEYMSISGEDGIEIGKIGSKSHMSLSAGSGMKFGDYFSVTPDGVITARRGEFAGFTMVPAPDGLDYFKSDWRIGSIMYRTWIRSAADEYGGDTQVFGAHIFPDGVSGGRIGFIVTARGELDVCPTEDNGEASGTRLYVKRDEIYIGSSKSQVRFNAGGIYIYPGETVTNQPNLYWNTATGYLAYTTWSASSEQIKKNVNAIRNKQIKPENLYDVDIVQFRYKDEYLDKEDARYDKDLIGFLIEDLDKKYPIAVDKADPEDAKTWAWNSAYLIPAMMKLIQDQKKEIDDLKNDIAEIKATLKGG